METAHSLKIKGFNVFIIIPHSIHIDFSFFYCPFLSGLLSADNCKQLIPATVNVDNSTHLQQLTPTPSEEVAHPQLNTPVPSEVVAHPQPNTPAPSEEDLTDSPQPVLVEAAPSTNPFP